MKYISIIICTFLLSCGSLKNKDKLVFEKVKGEANTFYNADLNIYIKKYEDSIVQCSFFGSNAVLQSEKQNDTIKVISSFIYKDSLIKIISDTTSNYGISEKRIIRKVQEPFCSPEEIIYDDVDYRK